MGQIVLGSIPFKEYVLTRCQRKASAPEAHYAWTRSVIYLACSLLLFKDIDDVL